MSAEEEEHRQDWYFGSTHPSGISIGIASEAGQDLIQLPLGTVYHLSDLFVRF